jgi:hypothetical protein
MRFDMEKLPMIVTGNSPAFALGQQRRLRQFDVKQ